MSEGPSRVQWRFRLLTCCIALTTIALIQAPGRIVADTKLDLVINPGGFLHRALDLWDPQGSFGQVQNQAYGYLFPMGPFFWLGHGAGLEPWVIQRLWWALLLCVAFLGMVRLARELGVMSPNVRLLAGFAFALSPRILSVIGPSSIEVWPSALAPWVLLPLVIGTRRGNPVKMAALSAVAVLAVGGVNAAASFAVIPLGALWLLMAEPGPRRRRLMLWWPVFVLLGALWWLIPLFLLGSYSPPFLNFIESATNTTIAATMFDGLRGTSDWVAYVSADASAGKNLISQPMLIVNGAVVMALGLVGLARRQTPHRRFLIAGLALGMVCVTAGHLAAVSGLGAAEVQSALDGVLAPLRNTHKFDVMVRLPLVLGLAHLLSSLAGEGRRPISGDEAIKALGITVLAVAAVAGATSPAWAGQLANKGSFDGIPGYWYQASSWLDRHASGRSLLVPASAFPEYLWGSTGDEPIQALTNGDWAVRNSIPLSNAGTIKLLDAVTVELAQGTRSAGLATTLRRSGVEYLVLRNDLDGARLPANQEAAFLTLSRSDGISEVKSFGPPVGSDPGGFGGDLRSFVDGGWQSRHPAIEIFKVSDPGSTRAQNSAATPTVVGSAASLAALDNLGVTDNRSVVLAQDQPRGLTPSSVILTDESRRQEAAFGSVYDNRSASLAPSDRYSSNRPVHDYVTAADGGWDAVPELIGAAGVTASSSRSAATTLGGARPGEQPYAAFDGNAMTSWVADGPDGSLTVRLSAKRDLGQVTVRADLAPGASEQVNVSTASGRRSGTLTGNRPLTFDVGDVSALTVSGSAGTGRYFSVAEISSPALVLSRPLVLPRMPSSWPAPATIALGLDSSRRPGCLDVQSLTRCRADVASPGEDGAVIDRIVSLPAGGAYAPSILVFPVDGADLEGLLQRGLRGAVSASSTVNDDPRAGISRVIDQDTRTGWIARPGDTDPTITMTWTARHTLREINLATSPSLPASIPTTAVLDFGNGQQRTVTFVDGRATFAPVVSDRVEVHLSSDKPTRDYDSIGLNAPLPVGVSELWFRGATLTADFSPKAITLPCGAGPSLSVNGRTYETSVATTAADLAEAVPARATICKAPRLDLVAGRNRITLTSSPMFRPTSLVMTRAELPSGSSTAVERTDHSSDSRTIAIGPGAQRIVNTTENFNPGWKARGPRSDLTAVQVNGWQQGWVVPAGMSGPINLTYAPNRGYHLGLIAGGASALALVMLALWLRRDVSIASRIGRRRRLLAGRWVLISAGGLTAVVLGGVPLLAAGIVGAVAATAFRRLLPAPEWLVTVPITLATLLYAIHPYGGRGSWAGSEMLPQLCVGTALGVVLGLLVDERQDFRRRKGSSTTR